MQRMSAPAALKVRVLDRSAAGRPPSSALSIAQFDIRVVILAGGGVKGGPEAATSPARTDAGCNRRGCPNETRKDAPREAKCGSTS